MAEQSSVFTASHGVMTAEIGVISGQSLLSQNEWWRACPSPEPCGRVKSPLFLPGGRIVARSKG